MHYFEIVLRSDLPLEFDFRGHRWRVAPNWVTTWGYIAAYLDGTDRHVKLGGQAGFIEELDAYANSGWFAWYTSLDTAHALHLRMAELGLVTVRPSHERGWMDWRLRARAHAIPVELVS